MARRPVMIICAVIDFIGVCFLATAIGLPSWIGIDQTYLSSISSGNIGLFWSCLYLVNTDYCTDGTTTTTRLIISRALCSAGAGITLIAAIVVIVYLCKQTACGRRAVILSIILVLHLLALISAAAGCGLFLAYFLPDGTAYINIAGYVYIVGVVFIFGGLILSVMEIVLVQKQQKRRDDRARQRLDTMSSDLERRTPPPNHGNRDQRWPPYNPNPARNSFDRQSQYSGPMRTPRRDFPPPHPFKPQVEPIPNYQNNQNIKPYNRNYNYS